MINVHAMKYTMHNKRQGHLKGAILLPKDLAAVTVDDIVESVKPLLQEQVAEKMVRLEAIYNRFQHVHRRRPFIYIDFKKLHLLRKGHPSAKLPASLATRTLEYLFRKKHIDLIGFHIIPRMKRSLSSRQSDNLTRSFATEISRLRNIISEKTLPIQLAETKTKHVWRLAACGVRSNIHVSLEIAENAQHLFEMNTLEGVASMVKQALIIDPDCKLAAIIATRLVRTAKFVTDSLAESIVRAQNCLTRELLVCGSNIDRLDGSLRNRALVGEIITEAHRRISILDRQLHVLWAWQNGLNHENGDQYHKALQLIAQVALAKLRRPEDSSYAFEQLMDIQEIRKAIDRAARNYSRRNHAIFIAEIQLRIWRHLFVDGWLPPEIGIDNLASSLCEAVRNRLRLSNTPDGAGRILGVEYCDEWVEVKAQEDGPDLDI